MKKTLLFIIIFAAVNLLANQFNLLEFRTLPADFHAERNSVMDMDMEYCSALKVESDIRSELNLRQKVYKKENLEPGLYYFFVSHKEKQITFSAPNFQDLTVDVPAEGLKRGITYYIRLETIPDITVTLNVSPKPDRIILNNKIMQKNRFNVAPGIYRLQIEKEGYETIDEEITINADNSNFNYSLAAISREIIVEKQVEAAREKPPVDLPDGSVEFSRQRFDVLYEVLSCDLYDDQLIINMMITNNAYDNEVKILVWNRKHYSRFIDDVGNEFTPEIINFANKTYHGDLAVTLVQGIPTKASLTFKNVNRNMTSAALFDLGIWTKQNDNFRVTFRNLPISKK